MINGYKILSDFTLYRLQEEVNSAIKLGWQPIGGVCATYGKFSESIEPDGKGKEMMIHAQALVK